MNALLNEITSISLQHMDRDSDEDSLLDFVSDDDEEDDRGSVNYYKLADGKLDYLFERVFGKQALTSNFSKQHIEKEKDEFVEHFKNLFEDKEMKRLFEETLPNTLKDEAMKKLNHEKSK